MIINRKSVLSGISHSKNIPVNPDDYAAWKSGLGNIQELMPYLNEDDREFILSGITPEEWDSAFSERLEDIISDSLIDDEAPF